MRKVPRDHIHPYVHPTQKRLDQPHFGDFAGRCDEQIKRVARGLVQRDAQEHLNLIAKRAGINVDLTSLDHAALLQPLKPPPAGRRGQTRGISQGGCAQRRIILQKPKQSPVEIGDFLHETSDK